MTDNQSVIRQMEFSVVDSETTGLFPERSDRIIEIAIVRVDHAGNLIDHYCTLVNPHRDLGATHIHHISAGDVMNAPSFEEIAGDVLIRLRGAIFTGFNVHFDLRFLQSELVRIGESLPTLDPLCVMRLAGQVAPDLPGRKLEICCKHFGIPLQGSHSAYNDALATALLLSKCLSLAQAHSFDLLNILPNQLASGKQPWPDIPPSGKALSRTDSSIRVKDQPSYIQRLVSRLPSMTAINPFLDEYVSLLDCILDDRIITADEAALLFARAEDIGLSRESACEAHRMYMRDLIRVALADEKITNHEDRDLKEVSRLLSLSDEEYHSILREVKKERTTTGSGKATPRCTPQNYSGVTICFTGELNSSVGGKRISREEAEAIAQQKGMVVKQSVTRKLGMLVVADPNSMSGKAKKARQYGIRVIAEPVFLNMLGIDID